MTNFEVEITYNMICRPGQVVRIHIDIVEMIRRGEIRWK